MGKYTMSSISVVIPVYGNLSYTIGCVSSLIDKSKLVDEIIIIENGPQHENVMWLLGHTYPFKIYIPGENLGVSKSWDTGIKLAKNNLVAVINNDIEIVDDAWDQVLLEQWSHHPNAAIFCPWPCHDVGEELHRDNEPMDGLNGSFFVIKKNSLQLTDNYKRKGEYIDTNYKTAYWEDADLLVQTRRAGFESKVTPKVKTVHYTNITAGKLLPRDKGMHNPYWQNLDYFNKKYNIYIWDYFKVFMSNVLDENTNKRLI
jgi:O-antigen biosynthesis protein